MIAAARFRALNVSSRGWEWRRCSTFRLGSFVATEGALNRLGRLVSPTRLRIGCELDEFHGLGRFFLAWIWD